jgi:hypothetical protein
VLISARPGLGCSYGLTTQRFLQSTLFREGILIAIVNTQALALTVTRDLRLPQDNDYTPTVQNVPLPTVHLREDQLWSGNISVGERFPQLPQTHLDYYDSPANVRVFDNIPLIDILEGLLITRRIQN